MTAIFAPGDLQTYQLSRGFGLLALSKDPCKAFGLRITSHVTFVKASPPGDALFPAIDWSQWREIRREDHQPQKGDEAGFAFVDFERRGSASSSA